jgi:hypothetical protein
MLKRCKMKKKSFIEGNWMKNGMWRRCKNVKNLIKIFFKEG